MQRFFALFKTNDAIMLPLIALLSVAAARFPDVFESKYPSSFYSILTTVAQSLAPLLAVLLGMGLYLRSKEASMDLSDMLKSAALLCCVVMLSMALMPFSDALYNLPNIRQGVMATLLMLSLWAFGRAFASVVAVLMPQSVSKGNNAETHT